MRTFCWTPGVGEAASQFWPRPIRPIVFVVHVSLEAWRIGACSKSRPRCISRVMYSWRLHASSTQR